MLSDKKKLQIANICYANVSGQFALFANPKNRGPDFTWDWFIKHCEENADLWMIIHHVYGTRGDVTSINETAKQMCSEIAKHLVWHITK